MAGRNVAFSKPKTPSFIEKFKEKVGYKEPDTVETKFEEPESSNLDDTEHVDEKPTVVLGSNVTEAEADAFLERLKKEEEASSQDADEGGHSDKGSKIIFKKPTKRKSSETEKDLQSKDDRKKSKPASSMKKVKNKSLLSFDDEEDGD